jgi:ferredoxin
MIPLSSSPADPPTIEQGINALVGDAKRTVCERYKECEQCVRESPTKAILLAAAAGYCLHRMPVRALLVAQVRLLTSLAPPTLLAFGAAKLCEFLQGQAREKGRLIPKPRNSENPSEFR